MYTLPSLLFLFSIFFIETVFCSDGSIIKPLKLTGWECYQLPLREHPFLTEANSNKFWTRKSSFMTPEQLFVSKGNQEKNVFHLNSMLEKAFALANEDSKHQVTLYFSDFSDFTLPNRNEVGIARLNNAVELIDRKLSNNPDLALIILLSDIDDGKINDTAIYGVVKRAKVPDLVGAKDTGALSDISPGEELKYPSKHSEQARNSTFYTAKTTVPTSTPKTTQPQPQQRNVPTNTNASTKKKPETEKIDIDKIILKIDTKPYKEALKSKKNSWEEFVLGVGVFLGVITFVTLVYYLMTELSKGPEVEL